MPRYRLSPGAAADLVAYLKELDAAEEPGVGTDRITLGVMLPPERSGSPAGLAIRETLLAAFDEVNRTGGIYGRRLECRFATAPDQGLVRAWEAFLAQEKPFAVLGSYMEGAETEVSRLIERERIPFIQSLPPSGRAPAQVGRYLFHLVAGWETQCAALARFAAENDLLAGVPSLVLSDDPGGAGPVVERIAALAKAGGWPVPRIIRADEVADWASVLRSSQGAAMFWLGGGEPLEKLFQAAERVGIYPTVLAPASSTGSRMLHAPAGFAGRLYLGVSAVPGDAEPEGRAEFFRLARSARFTESELTTRLIALSAAKVLMHLVSEGGRELTRERVVTLAERLYEFHPGYTRSVTFTQSRRMGASGAHVAGIDLANACLALPVRWLESPPLREMGDSSLPLSRTIYAVNLTTIAAACARMPDSHF
jgi:branched-chain amino acid transport system substrate-binding protein